MGSLEKGRRSQRLCLSYDGGHGRGAEGGLPRVLCVASSIPARDYETWKYIAPIQKDAWEHKSFEYGTWGGELRHEFQPQPGDVVALEHWGSSGFANTDLDLQLKEHGIHKLIVIGLIAHTCVEATVRFAAELGYEVSMVKDATADYGDEEMHAALDINIPNYANAVVTTDEIIDSIVSLSAAGKVPSVLNR